MPRARIRPHGRVAGQAGGETCVDGLPGGVVCRHFTGSSGEADHLIPIAIGGANSRANLWPEAATPYPGSHEKDELENALSELVCRRLVPLAFAQRLTATDWIAAGRWVDEHFPGLSRTHRDRFRTRP
jgi:hypothetical protein